MIRYSEPTTTKISQKPGQVVLASTLPHPKAERKLAKTRKRVTKVAEQVQAGAPDDAPDGGKKFISIWLSTEVIAMFKAQAPGGKGYQTLINQALLRMVRDGVDRWL